MTDEKPHIRLLEPADLPALLAIIADVRAACGPAGSVPELPEPADRALYARYQRQRALYFVAVAGQEVVGGAGIAALNGADPLTCELRHMYLRRDARGRGVGTALLAQCLQAARQLLYVRCCVEAAAHPGEALKFYERHGFRELDAPLGRTPGTRGDRWLARPLRAAARQHPDRTLAAVDWGQARVRPTAADIARGAYC
jgi:putative acetyltransferase